MNGDMGNVGTVHSKLINQHTVSRYHWLTTHITYFTGSMINCYDADSFIIKIFNSPRYFEVKFAIHWGRTISFLK